jgi:hypothetical protein
MKANRDFRSMLVSLLLVAAVTVALLAIGCFGGGGDNSGTGATIGTSSGGGATTAGAASTTTATGSADSLSSFKSKNPFLAQAQATTTIVVTTVVKVTTTTTAHVTTTTAPHRLTVTAFPGGALVTFTLDGTTLSGFGAGTAVFQGAWGSIQIIAVNDTIAPYTATFRRIGYTPDIVLPLNGYRTW